MQENFALIGLLFYFAILFLLVFKGQKSKNFYDYFFARRNLPFYALSLTFVASWWGAGSALSTADLAFSSGMSAFFYYGVPVLISSFIMIILSALIRRVGYLTQGQMFEERYSLLNAKVLSLMILIFMIFNSAAQMVGLGLFFNEFLGLTYLKSIIFGTTIVIIYSSVGGFRAVVLTDILQFFLLSISAFIVFFVALNEAGGFENIDFLAKQRGQNEYFNIFHNMKDNFIYVITFGCSWAIQANVWQRISASKDDKSARKMAIMSFFVFIPLYLIVVLTGMAGSALFQTLPKNGIISEITNTFMSPVLASFVFVGICAAIMSTMDSLINTAAMTLVVDFKFGFSKFNGALNSRLANILVSFLALFIALKIRSILELAWLASDLITSSIFVPLIMGFYWKRGNSKGALASMIWGFAYCSFNLALAQKFIELNFFDEHSAFRVLFGLFSSLILYISFSLVFKENENKAIKFINKAKGIS